MFSRPAILIIPFLLAGFPLYGSADAGHAHEHSINFGKPAAANQADRQIEVILSDMTFKPEHIRVNAGETIHFVVKNHGKLLHEFNLGTAQMHAAHQQEMIEMLQAGQLTPTGINHEAMHQKGAMQHDDPNSVLVEPGATAQLTWTFTQPGTIQFACNVPGHYSAGMVGNIEVNSDDDS